MIHLPVLAQVFEGVARDGMREVQFIFLFIVVIMAIGIYFKTKDQPGKLITGLGVLVVVALVVFNPDLIVGIGNWLRGRFSV